MSDKVKIALIAAVAVVVSIWMLTRTTPYEDCIEARTGELVDRWSGFGTYEGDIWADAERAATIDCSMPNSK